MLQAGYVPSGPRFKRAADHCDLGSWLRYKGKLLSSLAASKARAPSRNRILLAAASGVVGASKSSSVRKLSSFNRFEKCAASRSPTLGSYLAKLCPSNTVIRMKANSAPFLNAPDDQLVRSPMPEAVWLVPPTCPPERVTTT